jgi:uncharacterized protein (TIRG00374 family)
MTAASKPAPETSVGHDENSRLPPTAQASPCRRVVLVGYAPASVIPEPRPSDHAPRRRLQPVAMRYGGLFISAVGILGVAWWAFHQDLPRFPHTAHALSLIAAASAIYLVGTLLRGERWYQLLRAAHVAPTRRSCCELTFVGYMGNSVLPARGGDVLRIYLLGREQGISRRVALGSLVAERLLDVLVLGALFVLLAYGLLQDVPRLTGATLVVTVAALALLAAAAVTMIRLVRRSGRFLVARAFVAPALVATRALTRVQGIGLAALTLLIWAFESATYFVVGAAVDLDMSPLEALYLVALTGLFVMIPAGPGNLGTFDAGVLIGARAVGARGGAAVPFLLMLRFVLVVPVTVIGFVLLVTRHGGWGRLRQERTTLDLQKANT